MPIKTEMLEDESKITVYTQTESEWVRLHIDTLKYELHIFLEKIKKAKDVLTPLGMFLTIFITLLTVEFKDSFGISKDTIYACFIISCIITGLWLISSLISLVKKWRKKEFLSVEEFIKELKKKCE